MLQRGYRPLWGRVDERGDGSLRGGWGDGSLRGGDKRCGGNPVVERTSSGNRRDVDICVSKI